MIKRFDLASMKKEDVNFETPFVVTAHRNDNVHALVLYFDVEFSQCPHPVRFSTGPFSRQTHWKQTVFYIPEPIYLAQGEQIQGFLRMQNNAKNPRDIDIDIQFHQQGKEKDQVARYRLR